MDLIRARAHPSASVGHFGAVLVRYKTEGATSTPPSLASVDPLQHLRGAIAGRVQAGAQWLRASEGGMAAPVRVVWFDAADYDAWRSLQGLQSLPDSHALRSRWAGQALANQAIPHRLDQPPA